LVLLPTALGSEDYYCSDHQYLLIYDGIKQLYLHGGDYQARKNGPELKNKRDEERRGSVGPLGGLSFVPAQSSETARKILETLERMTPSPRGKSLEEELALVREQPPTVLTSSMLNNKASLTMQTWKFPDLHEVENAGPSDSKVEKDLLSVEEFGWRGTDHSTKLKGNGKAPLFGSTEVSYENATGWYHIACGTSFISQWH
jgi:hypothetical protein